MERSGEKHIENDSDSDSEKDDDKVVSMLNSKIKGIWKFSYFCLKSKHHIGSSTVVISKKPSVDSGRPKATPRFKYERRYQKRYTKREGVTKSTNSVK